MCQRKLSHHHYRQVFPVSYSKFQYPCIQTHIFLKLPLSLKAFSSSIEFLLLRSSFLMKPRIEFSFSPFNSLSPKAFSFIEVLFLRSSLLRSHGLLNVWRCGCWCVSLMFERVYFRSDFGLKIWVLFEFVNGFRYDVWSWSLIVFGNKTCWV